MALKFLNKRFFTILVLVASFISCKAQVNPKLDYIIKKNAVIEIKLDSNPTTGYSWKLSKNQANNIVNLIDEIYVPTKVESGIVGSGGNQIFKFKATKRGLGSLAFEYCRPWEQHSTVKNKVFKIKVK
jgi:predicted secreted protein